MKHTVQIFLVLVLSSVGVISQNTFIQRHHIKEYDNAYYTTVMATDSGYWAFGIIWDTTKPYLGGTAIYQFDLNGNMIHHKDYISKTEFRGFNKDMFYRDGKLITSILHPYDSVSVICYNVSKDSFVSLLTVRNLVPQGDFLSVNNLFVDQTGNFYLANSVSSKTTTESFTQIQLVKYNHKLEFEWSRLLGNQLIDEIPYSIKLDQDGNIYVGGQRWKLKYFQGDNNYSNALVYKLDPQGNLLKETVSEKLSGPV